MLWIVRALCTIDLYAVSLCECGLKDEFVSKYWFSDYTERDFLHFGMTPLIICSINGYYRCAELLLSLDANVNMRDQISGRTALFHAAERQDLDMVQILLNYNAETKIKNFFGTSAHDAMYEIDDIKPKIKNLILGRSLKRRNTEDTRGMAKFKRPTDSKIMGLKTYSRLQKIRDIPLIKNLKREKSHGQL